MRAKKSLGQNFLRDDDVIRRIVGELSLSDSDTVIEIGPGHGALTAELVESGANVLAIEIDREFVPALRTQFRLQNNFHVVEADVLDTDFSTVLETFGFQTALGSDLQATSLRSGTDLALEPGAQEPLIKLVANLPYNISTPILQRLIKQRNIFSKLVLMFQREVVERITASPGGKERGFLSVLVDASFATEYLFDVSPNAFEPIPKVWSAVVRLIPKPSNVTDEARLREVVSSCFLQKRKTLLNNLKVKYANAGVILEKIEIDGRRRAETLTLDEWIMLSEAISDL